MSKTVTILGSTGSIGVSTLRVVKFLDGEYRVYGLTCQKNITLLEAQIREFHPEAVAVESTEIVTSDEYRKLKKRYTEVEFLEGEDGVMELAGRQVDLLVSAIVGAAGLKPTLNAVKNCSRIALANKETLVMAGDIFTERIRSEKSELIPVDSEHSAVFSLLDNINSSHVERIILTASGGSLRNLPVEKMESVSPEMALDHPTWDMGNKITIDSATLMNKGLEVIEAHYLFGFEYERIDVLIHPESIVHSMVELVDGALHAHMGVADMALPILNAMKYPEKIRNDFGRLKLEEIGSLHFAVYDRKRYPSLELCYSAGKEGGTMPAVLNAANEVAVDAFLSKKIKFTDIVRVVDRTMNKLSNIKDPDIDDIITRDFESREISKSIIEEVM
jgi:1-deoxy-D-xylulose-5-phosphate reductoisomerase